MAQDRGEIRDVVWQEVFPWLCLFRAVLLAFDPRKVILAVVALTLTAAGWWGLSHVFTGEAPGAYGRFPWQWFDQARVDRSFERELGNFLNTRTAREPTALNDAATRSPVADAVAPFRDLFRERITLSRLALATCSALWALAVWAFFGGAITRIAAVQLAQEQRSSLTKALGHAAQNGARTCRRRCSRSHS